MYLLKSGTQRLKKSMYPCIKSIAQYSAFANNIDPSSMC